jgi:hypothetical protein
MAKTSKITQALLGTAFALGAMTATNDANAQALQGGQCYTRDVFNQTITNEGMRTLVVGNSTSTRADASSPTGARGVDFINGVAANLSNGQGYLFVGDQPRGTPSNQICVTVALEGTALYDINSTAIPRSAYLGGRFNDVVNRSAADGERPMVVANTVIGSGASRRNGLPVVVFGNPTDRTGVIATRTTDGQPTMLGVLHTLEYTPFAQERLASQGRQVASNDAAVPAIALRQ